MGHGICFVITLCHLLTDIIMQKPKLEGTKLMLLMKTCFFFSSWGASDISESRFNMQNHSHEYFTALNLQLNKFNLNMQTYAVPKFSRNIKLCNTLPLSPITPSLSPLPPHLTQECLGLAAKRIWMNRGTICCENRRKGVREQQQKISQSAP